MQRTWLINFIFWLIAPALFLFTRNPITGPWKLLFAFLLLIWLVVDLGFRKTRGKRALLDICLFGLALVGATNWFFSPFFFVLYFLIMAISFVLPPITSFGFVISLVLIFLFNVGEVDVAYDSLVLLSLLATYPIALILRREYLRLQENQKRILILEKEANESQTTVQKLLSNVVTNAAAELRQPLVNIKNYASVMAEGKQPAVKTKEYAGKIYESALIALDEINKFDEASTGRKIKH